MNNLHDNLEFGEKMELEILPILQKLLSHLLHPLACIASLLANCQIAQPEDLKWAWAPTTAKPSA